ncbi:MAG TPA: SDR family oxidoreductase, partial [Hyphomicrobiales bacterium]|nr:SDR family oxidoreductase [Hyphomicrobiales bacterium]
NESRLRLQFPSLKVITCDFAKDRVIDWEGRLAGIEAVVNTAGIFRSTRRGRFETVHFEGPKALFEACARLRIPKLVQISALGADEGARSAFHLTKRQADDCCITLAQNHGLHGWIVVRPSLVIGRGGQSTALFSALGALPFPPRLGPGNWKIQPIHISDLARGIRLLLEHEAALPPRLDFVGPEPLTTDELTHALRRWLLLPAAKSLPLPLWLLRASALTAGVFSMGSLSRDSLAMLERGNVAPVAPLREVLGWEPRPVLEALLSQPSTQADLWHARLYFLKPTLRIGLALLWIGTALVSAFIYPLSKSIALVSGLGVDENQAVTLVYAGAALDAVLGLLLLFDIRPRVVGLVQIATVLVFTVLATIAVPAAWLEPFGPLSKNVAVILATLAMIALE